MTFLNDAAVEIEARHVAAVALTAPDGLEHWQRWIHSRCNGTTIRCPRCPNPDDLASVADWGALDLKDQP